eukprot:403342106
MKATRTPKTSQVQEQGSLSNLSESPKTAQKQQLPETQVVEDIYIHMVSHSHQDVGWNLSPEDYYSQKVKRILDSLMVALKQNETRKFTYAEIYYFEKWWNNQDATTKNFVRKLIKDGRWEFVNGGWVASDEACPTFEDFQLNIMIGNAFLKREFGIVPEFAWHCDPFGHSAVTPELFYQMGYKGLFFARVDDDEKNYRKNHQEMEFIWKPKFETAAGQVQSKSELFTHVMHFNYQGGCDIEIWTYNTDRAYQTSIYRNQLEQHKTNKKRMINCVKQYAEHYKTNHILFTMGVDFAYQNADITYEYIEGISRILSEDNAQGSLKLIFQPSTVKEYYEAIMIKQQEMQFEWPTYSDDFFPYNGNFQQHLWTGYFTSRPYFKKQIKDFSSLAYSSTTFYALQHFKELNDNSGVQLPKNLHSNITPIENMTAELLKNLAMMQHHDTITGTSPTSVIQNHVFRLEKTQYNNTIVLQNLIQSLVIKDGINMTSLEQCYQQIHQRLLCPANQVGDEQTFVVYNPSVFDRNVTKLQFPTSNLKVSAWQSKTQSFKSLDSQSEIMCTKNPQGKRECDLIINYPVPYLKFQIFKVTNLDKANISSTNDTSVREIKPSKLPGNDSKPDEPQQVCNKTLYIENQNLRLHVVSCNDATSSVVFQVTHINKDQTVQKPRQFEFDFRYYVPYHDNELRPSGLYVFKTADFDSTPFPLELISIQAQRGKNLQQLVLRYKHSDNSKTIVKIKLAQNSDEFEFDVHFGRIKAELFKYGADITINWKSLDIAHEETFYTDANSLKIVKRGVENQQTAQNFYPVTNTLFISDESQRTANPQSQVHFMVFNDGRSQGGSAFQPGRLELMINRYGLGNDQLGMHESLIEKDEKGKFIEVDAKFWITYQYGRQNAWNKIMRRHQKTMNHQQIFQADYYENVYGQQLDSNFVNAEKNQYRSFIETYQIRGISLVPTNSFENIYILITRQQNNQPIDITKLKKLLCDHIVNSPSCSQDIASIIRVDLRGNEFDNKDQVHQFMPHEAENNFIVENFKIIIQD